MPETGESAPWESVMQRVRSLVADEQLRITQHAQQEMAAEDISLDQVLEALAAGGILEDYPQHKRGACCLIHGTTRHGRHLHVVCTSTASVLIIITVYEPRPPKWVTPVQRGVGS